MKPDSEIDPESAALLRQLHRELNGLPSRRTKVKASAAHDFEAQVKRRRTGGEYKRSVGGDGSQQPGRARSANPSTTVSEAGSARTSYEKDSSRQAAPGKQRHQQHKAAAGRSHAREGLDSVGKPHKGSSSENQSNSQLEHSMQQKAASKAERPKASSVAVAALPPGRHKEHSYHLQQQQRVVQQHPKHNHVQKQQRSPPGYGSATLRAAELARNKAAAAQCCAKCFVAGTLWGVSLPPSALQTKQSLAKALSTAYPDLRSGGAGGSLHVVFVEKSGRTYECPAHCQACAAAAAASGGSSGSGVGSGDGWACRGRDVVRLYVR